MFVYFFFTHPLGKSWGGYIQLTFVGNASWRLYFEEWVKFHQIKLCKPFWIFPFGLWHIVVWLLEWFWCPSCRLQETCILLCFFRYLYTLRRVLHMNTRNRNPSYILYIPSDNFLFRLDRQSLSKLLTKYASKGLNRLPLLRSSP